VWIGSGDTWTFSEESLAIGNLNFMGVPQAHWMVYFTENPKIKRMFFGVPI
jgi:hypothetical protein